MVGEVRAFEGGFAWSVRRLRDLSAVGQVTVLMVPPLEGRMDGVLVPRDELVEGLGDVGVEMGRYLTRKLAEGGGDGLGDGEGWTSPVARVRYAACKLWQESQADDSGLISLGKVKRDCPAYYVDLELGNTPRRGTPTNMGSIPPGRRPSKISNTQHRAIIAPAVCSRTCNGWCDFSANTRLEPHLPYLNRNETRAEVDVE